MADYDAFISYRRSDGQRVANWLRRELEGFRAPRKLPGLATRRLRVYLDTAYERGTNDFYEHSIRPALLASQYLIVIATPDALGRGAGKVDWMQRELSEFMAGPNGRNVLAVRGAGEFPGELPVDLAARFPNIEVIDLRGAGWLSYLNPLRATRLANEKLKLLAPLLDVPLQDIPALRLEEETRQQIKLGATAGVSFAVLALVAGASVFAFKSLWTAREALQSSMFSTERMISAISDQLAPEDTPYGARGVLLNQACDLIDKLAEQANGAPSIRERVLCQIERARGREAQKELALAQVALENAVRMGRAALDGSGSSAAGRAMLDASSSLVDFLLRTNAPDKASGAIDRLLADAAQLADKHPNEPAFLTSQADGYARRAILLESGKDTKGQLAAIEQAIGYVAKAAAHRETLLEQRSNLLSWQANLFAQAAHAALDSRDLASVVRYLREAAGVRGSIDWTAADHPARRSSENEASITELYIGIAAFEHAQGHAVQARDAMAQARRRLALIGSTGDVPPELQARLLELRSRLDSLRRDIGADAAVPTGARPS